MVERADEEDDMDVTEVPAMELDVEGVCEVEEEEDTLEDDTVWEGEAETIDVEDFSVVEV